MTIPETTTDARRDDPADMDKQEVEDPNEGERDKLERWRIEQQIAEFRRKNSA